MTYTALIAFAPLMTAERVNDPAWQRPGRTIYGSLTFMPGETTAPVLAGHDHDRVIGTVNSIVRHEQIDGPWLVGIATIHDRPSWLERQTRVSFAYKPVHTNDDFFGCEVVHRGLITEVSVLPPWSQPAEPCASVLSIRVAEPKPPAREQIIYSEPTLLVRPGIGQVLGVR